MKKYLYLCIMMSLSMNIVAQIDLKDPNWEKVFFDDFTTNSWYTWEDWKITHPDPEGFYISYYKDGSHGVTHGHSEHQVYQRGNCLFGNGELAFVSVYEGDANYTPLNCDDYDMPPNKICDTTHHSLYYSSGLIQTLTKFKYGYFEISCSLPIHRGSFPAFWLYGAGTNYYNEIDIFEYSWGLSHTNHFKLYTCGLFCDNTNVPSNLFDISYARTNPHLPNGSNDLTHSHVFACEWMPERVIWYVDGKIVNECAVFDHIPHHAMYLIVNYAIDNYAVSQNPNLPVWFDGDKMVIDSIRVFRLKTNCDTDVLIENLLDLNNFRPSVKKSIKIESLGELVVPTNANLNMRAVDSIVITEGFTVPLGAQITLRTQPCPE